MIVLNKIIIYLYQYKVSIAQFMRFVKEQWGAKLSLLYKCCNYFSSTLSRRNVFAVIYLSKERQNAMCFLRCCGHKNNPTAVLMTAAACDFAYLSLILPYFTRKCAENMKKTNFYLVDKSSLLFGAGDG